MNIVSFIISIVLQFLVGAQTTAAVPYYGIGVLTPIFAMSLVVRRYIGANYSGTTRIIGVAGADFASLLALLTFLGQLTAKWNEGGWIVLLSFALLVLSAHIALLSPTGYRDPAQIYRIIRQKARVQGLAAAVVEWEALCMQQHRYTIKRAFFGNQRRRRNTYANDSDREEDIYHFSSTTTIANTNINHIRKEKMCSSDRNSPSSDVEMKSLLPANANAAIDDDDDGEDNNNTNNNNNNGDGDNISKTTAILFSSSSSSSSSLSSTLPTTLISSSASATLSSTRLVTPIVLSTSSSSASSSFSSSLTPSTSSLRVCPSALSSSSSSLSTSSSSSMLPLSSRWSLCWSSFLSWLRAWPLLEKKPVPAGSYDAAIAIGMHASGTLSLLDRYVWLDTSALTLSTSAVVSNKSFAQVRLRSNPLTFYPLLSIDVGSSSSSSSSSFSSSPLTSTSMSTISIPSNPLSSSSSFLSVAVSTTSSSSSDAAAAAADSLHLLTFSSLTEPQHEEQQQQRQQSPQPSESERLLSSSSSILSPTVSVVSAPNPFSASNFSNPLSSSTSSTTIISSMSTSSSLETASQQLQFNNSNEDAAAARAAVSSITSPRAAHTVFIAPPPS